MWLLKQYDMENLILAISPIDRKIKKSQFNVRCSGIKKGIDILNEMYPEQYRVIGVSKYIGSDDDFVDKLLY